jgi:hypothetical protein
MIVVRWPVTRNLMRIIRTRGSDPTPSAKPRVEPDPKQMSAGAFRCRRYAFTSILNPN